MHNNNTLHRDIKPGNLFLNKWNDIKLGDFGLSTVVNTRMRKKELAVGTLGYAAPEILNHKPFDTPNHYLLYVPSCVYATYPKH